jgi:hypothetical protein
VTDNVMRLPGTEDLFTANPRGAVGVYPSATGGGCWGVVHIARAGTTIALLGEHFALDDAQRAAQRAANDLGAELVEGLLL